MTFPADLAVRAYGSVLTILREGATIPAVNPHNRLLSGVSSHLHGWTAAVPFLGPLVAAAAVAVAWNAAPRLGVALALFILFLAGYPAIEFEERHWFHLRFLPWWSAALVAHAITQVIRSRPGEWRWPPARGGPLFVVSALTALALVLGGLRIVQRRSVSALISAYLVAPVEGLSLTRPERSTVRVGWTPDDYGEAPQHRSSDLLAVTFDAEGCTPAGALDIVVRYEAELPSHDMSSAVTVMRAAPGAPPTQLFFPVFALGASDHSYLRFAGIEVAQRASDCISRVARVTNRGQLPLWLQLQVPPDWAERRLYQSLDPARLTKAGL